MESLEEGSKSSKTFLKHVFNFDEDSKTEMLNVVQYSVLAIIPVIILNKAMQRFVPEAEEEKGSLEILVEVLIQVVVMFIGLLFVHRIITYVPTYSGSKYPEFSILYMVLAVLMITLSLQTKLGEKVSILVERITELWEGKKDDTKGKKKNGKNNGSVKVTQPISQNVNQAAMSQAMYTDGTSINQLPIAQPSQQQQQPNFNDMYRNDSNPLVDAASPGQEGFASMEPMAANSVIGGGFGSTW